MFWEKFSTIPNSDYVAKIVKHFNIPTDFLLENGVFEHWDDLLSRKSEVIEFISTSTSKLSKEMLNGLDDISFAKLVYAFNIYTEEYEDGFNIESTNPISTYTSFGANTNEAPYSLHSESQSSAEYEWLSLFRQLPYDAQLEFKGEIKGYLKCLDKQSVAADEPNLGTGAYGWVK